MLQMEEGEARLLPVGPQERKGGAAAVCGFPEGPRAFSGSEPLYLLCCGSLRMKIVTSILNRVKKSTPIVCFFPW